MSVDSWKNTHKMFIELTPGSVTLTGEANGWYYHRMTKFVMTKNMTKKHLMTKSPYD